MKYYKRTNPLNRNQVYIGRTRQDIRARNCRDWADYYDTKISKKLTVVYSELEKAGLDFELELLEETDNTENFDEKEQYWIDFYSKDHELLNTGSANYNKTKRIVVSCYTLDGKLYKTFDSKLQASLQFGINNTNLDKALSGKTKRAAGYMWRYGAKENIEPYDGRMRRRKVHQYDKEGNYIATYPNIQSAAEAVGLKHSSSIHAVLSGRVKTAGGFIWKTVKI